MISGKTVLCAAAPFYGHTVPVLSLALELRRAGNKVSVISYSGAMDDLFARYQMAIASVESKPFNPMNPLEMMFHTKKILEAAPPEITICDASVDLLWALHGWRPPCTVSILRCELILGYERRNMFLPDKFSFEDTSYLEWLNMCFHQVGLPPIQDWRDLCKADFIVVPSIPQIDPLPAHVEELYPHSTFLYTGPLLVQMGAPLSPSLQMWMESCRKEGTPILVVTLGSLWGSKIYRHLAECLQRTDFGVIMVVPEEKERSYLEKKNGRRFQVTGFTNLRELVEGADIVLHHCGHGTLHTVLLAAKPSLTLPSGEYDREDNAVRLEELGCARHLGHDFFRKGFDSHALSSALMHLLVDSHIKNGVARMSKIVSEYVEQRGAAELLRALTNHNAFR